MRPKLLEDTLSFPTTDGVYFKNNQRTLRLKGQDMYRWVEALETYFNGQYTLEEIVDGLEPEQQAMVTDIVETLLSNGFLKDLSHDLPHTLTEQELNTYAAEIAFIASFRESAAATFEHFRTQRVLLIGSGLTMLALVHATLQAGTQHTTVWVTDECATATQRFQTYREQACERDPRQVLLEQEAPDWHDEAALRAALQDVDVVFHLSDRPMLQRALTLNTICFALQKPLVQAVIVHDQAVLGPLARPGEAGCWECAWRRRWANRDEEQHSEQHDSWHNDLTTPVSLLLGLPTAAAIANMLSFEYFKYLTEAGTGEISEAVLQLDLETLRGQHHPLLPHPLCQTCQRPSPVDEGAFLDTIHTLEAQEPLDGETFEQHVLTCFGTELGMFPYLGEGDFAQIPLNVSSLTISAPMYPEQSQIPLTITQAHLGVDATRRQLVLQGAALYAARLVDQRRLFSDSTGTWSWAYDLFTGQARRVSAAEAYPLHDIQQTPPDIRGVRAGLSWAEACASALLDHCLAFTLQEVQLGEARTPEVLLDTCLLDGQAEHFLRLVEQTEKTLHIYNVTGSLLVPTLAFCLDDETVLYATHVDVAQALETGLERVVQHLQALHEEQGASPLPAVPQLSHASQSQTGKLPVSDAPDGWRERLAWLSKKLHHHHWQALAIPLHHDPALTNILPFIVRVLLLQEEN